jgi:hypothetical protein
MDEGESEAYRCFSVGGPLTRLLRANVYDRAMPLAVPYLFPPTTNRRSDAHDPPTLALPAIWERFGISDARRE